VTGGDRVNLSERLEVLHRDLVTTEVEQDVLESTTVLSAKPSKVRNGKLTRDRWRERIGLGSTTLSFYR
jgi:hypothetical protein